MHKLKDGLPFVYYVTDKGWEKQHFLNGNPNSISKTNANFVIQILYIKLF